MLSSAMIRNITANDFRILAISDGLSYWNKHKMAGAEHSFELCRNIERVAAECDIKNDPKKALRIAAEKTADTLGASTCCIIMLDGDKKVLKAANIGDSGFLVLRKEAFTLRSVIKSVEQWHAFDNPFVVSHINMIREDRYKWGFS